MPSVTSHLDRTNRSDRSDIRAADWTLATLPAKRKQCSQGMVQRRIGPICAVALLTQPGERLMTRLRLVILAAFFAAMAFPAAAPADVYRIINDPRQAAQVRVDMIQQASTKINALYFLARNDRITQTALALLREASRRGVRVRLIVDARFNHLPGSMLAYLHDEGVEVRVYHPFTLNHLSWLFRLMQVNVVTV